MTYARLNPSLATAINLARDHAGSDERKLLKKEMFATAKAQFGIPDHIKVKAETRDTTNPDYLVLKDSKTGQTFALAPDGLWVNATRQAPAAPVQPTRWFLVGQADDLVDAAKDKVASEGSDWDTDSFDHAAATATEVVPGLRKDGAGNFYVLMTEDELI